MSRRGLCFPILRAGPAHRPRPARGARGLGPTWPNAGFPCSWPRVSPPRAWALAGIEATVGRDLHGRAGPPRAGAPGLFRGWTPAGYPGARAFRGACVPWPGPRLGARPWPLDPPDWQGPPMEKREQLAKGRSSWTPAALPLWLPSLLSVGDRLSSWSSIIHHGLALAQERNYPQGLPNEDKVEWRRSPVRHPARGTT